LRPRPSYVASVFVLLLVTGTVFAQAKPARIVSLIPAVTEMLFAIGAGDQVVGVSTFDTFPEEVTTRPKVGGLFDPNFEAILGLRPDLVVVYGTLRTIGIRVGRTAQAEALAAQLEREIADVRRSVAGRPRPKTLLVFDREEASIRGLFVSGGTGFLHDMLDAAGGANVMADVPREGLQLSLEQLLARAPEVVIELRGSERWSPERQARETAAWRTVSIPAVRANRVHFLAEDSLTIPGPRVAAAVRMIAGALR
jgi:ABC-type Fe3+-hydroxamate transport system substrate-binding protein